MEIRGFSHVKLFQFKEGSPKTSWSRAKLGLMFSVYPEKQGTVCYYKTRPISILLRTFIANLKLLDKIASILSSGQR